MAATRYAYDGLDLIAEYNGANTLQRRYVHGPGTDQPIVWYEGSGTTDRRFLMADERGSVVSVTNGSGAVLAINSYDEYGIPGAANLGRFGYTGQTWLPELGMYYYKARIYSPTLGRFMQTDPIGYGDGINWYNYVGSDPVNFTDPLGLAISIPPPDPDRIIVTGKRPKEASPSYCDTNPSSQLCNGNDGIVVYGTRPKKAPPTATGHDYRTYVQVCRRALTNSEGRDLISRFTVPNSSAGFPSSEGYHVVDVAGIPGGIVYTTYSNDGWLGSNVTTPFHAFVGTVDQRLSISEGSTYINTHGYGSAGSSLLGQFRDGIDGVAGKGIFELLDIKAAIYAKLKYPGC